MKTNEFRFKDKNGLAIGTQGWTVDNEKSSSIAYTGLWRGNKVVALLVSKGDYSSVGRAVDDVGQYLVDACSSYAERDKYKKQRDELLDALKFYAEERNYRAGTYHSESMDRLHETPPKVILDRGVKARAAIKKAEE